MHVVSSIIKGVSLVFFAGIFSSCTLSHENGKLAVNNKSEDAVEMVQIEASGKTLEIRNVKPHELKRSEYDVQPGDHYRVSVVFKSGKKIDKLVAYVSNGMKFDHQIDVTDNDFDIDYVRVE